MLHKLPSWLNLAISTFLLSINLVFWGSLAILGGVFKLCLPRSARRKIAIHLNFIIVGWSVINLAIIRLFNSIEIDIRGLDKLQKQDSYLLISNHQSWADIIFLSYFSIKHASAPKYFLKRELLRLPFVGIAAWGLDMPLMKRYSRQFIEKNPHLKGKDIETTKAACAKYKTMPVTIINFVEGSRFSKKRQQQRNSPYQNLLPPKAGGIAFTLAAMQDNLSCLLNVTVSYQYDTSDFIMKAMAKGKIRKVTIDIATLPINQEWIGDYFNDEAFKQSFQQRLNALWQEKDNHLQQQAPKL